MANNSPLKPGYQTTEFWLTVLGALAPILTAGVPPWISAVLIGLYTASRAYVKGQTPPTEPPSGP